MTILHKTLRLAMLFSAAALSIALSACLVGPKYHAPAPQQPPAPAYKETPTQPQESGGWTVAQPSDGMLRGKWWEIFNDAELNALEEQLNINNQNIKQYFENFMEARAIVREAHAQYFPTLSAAPSVSHSRISQNLKGSTTVTANGTGSSFSTQSTLYTLPLEASWAPDLWGKVRNTVREAQYAAQVSAADLENERLTEQAALAEYFFEIRGQDELQKIFDDTVIADQKALDLTRGLYETGIDDYISVVEAQTTLQSAQAGATNVGVARAQYEHAIAVLLGRAASNFSIPVKPMTVAPPPIPVGVPSELLERRPDIAAAERTMAEANAQIGIARAAYFPTLSLTGEAGFESSAVSNWLSWPSRFFSVGTSLSETIFDAGLRRATVQQYVSTYNADLASYRQTVLTAFQQVEDGLAEVRILSKEIEQDQQAVDSAQTYLKLEQARYETGIDPYADVLIAQTTVLSDQQILNALQVQRMTYAVALVQALGGGWDASQLPSPGQVAQKPPSAETRLQQ